MLFNYIFLIHINLDSDWAWIQINKKGLSVIRKSNLCKEVTRKILQRSVVFGFNSFARLCYQFLKWFAPNWFRLRLLQFWFLFCPFFELFDQFPLVFLLQPLIVIWKIFTSKRYCIFLPLGAEFFFSFLSAPSESAESNLLFWREREAQF